MSQSEQISLSGQLRDAIYQAAIRQLKETPRVFVEINPNAPESLVNNRWVAGTGWTRIDG